MENIVGRISKGEPGIPVSWPWFGQGGVMVLGMLLWVATVVSASADPAITNPAPASTLSSASVNFQWSSGAGVNQYYLYVGSGLGSSDIYMQSTGLGLSATVTNAPVDGRTLYVRLWWFVDAGWHYADFTYTAWTVPSITNPVPASTLRSSSVNFQWNGGTGVSQYYLYVGRSVGSSDIDMQDMGLGLSTTVTNLPVEGSALYDIR